MAFDFSNVEITSLNSPVAGKGGSIASMQSQGYMMTPEPVAMTGAKITNPGINGPTGMGN